MQHVHEYFQYFVFEGLSETKVAFFLSLFNKNMSNLLFQGMLTQALRNFGARLSGTLNIAVPARLSDTSSHNS